MVFIILITSLIILSVYAAWCLCIRAFLIIFDGSGSFVFLDVLETSVGVDKPSLNASNSSFSDIEITVGAIPSDKNNTTRGLNGDTATTEAQPSILDRKTGFTITKDSFNSSTNKLIRTGAFSTVANNAVRTSSTVVDSDRENSTQSSAVINVTSEPLNSSTSKHLLHQVNATVAPVSQSPVSGSRLNETGTASPDYIAQVVSSTYDRYGASKSENLDATQRDYSSKPTLTNVKSISEDAIEPPVNTSTSPEAMSILHTKGDVKQSVTETTATDWPNHTRLTDANYTVVFTTPSVTEQTLTETGTMPYFRTVNIENNAGMTTMNVTADLVNAIAKSTATSVPSNMTEIDIEVTNKPTITNEHSMNRTEVVSPITATPSFMTSNTAKRNESLRGATDSQSATGTIE